jgi:hypothetical protein
MLRLRIRSQRRGFSPRSETVNLIADDPFQAALANRAPGASNEIVQRRRTLLWSKALLGRPSGYFKFDPMN